MQAVDIYSDYDHFAWFYNKYWGGEYCSPALAIYNILLFPHLPDGCRILDLCCGAGQIANGLAARGYRVTGLDGSKAMLEFARANAPGVEFIRADARNFRLPDKFHGVISAFDSLNHIMNIEELKMVFRNVHAAMPDGGVFLFDLNLEDESEMLDNSLEMVEADHVCLVRASYKPEERLKRYDVTMFRLEDSLWRRSDLTLFQRYYDSEDVIFALVECGFNNIKTYDARREFGFTISDGRMFYLARK
jgi:SAM-dependent methyltransferase